KSIIRKKNKRYLAVTDTELRELIRQDLVVDEIHELENQCDNLREKAYHALMKELFDMKAFRELFIQDSEGKKGWLSCGSGVTLR
ncbi:1853_t:CDS:2, partial [Funneliformis caledonium]